MTDFLDQWAGTNATNARIASQEALIVQTTEALWALLQEQGVSKSVLAERMGTTKGYVSQVLSGSRNMTLRTLSDICFALGVKPNLLIQQGDSAVPAPRKPAAPPSAGATP